VNVGLRAGEPADLSILVAKLVTAFDTEVPDSSVPEQRVAFCTSGHRGSAFVTAFNDWHILAISQVIGLYHEQPGIPSEPTLKENL
jgi:phosphoglucomutase